MCTGVDIGGRGGGAGDGRWLMGLVLDIWGEGASALGGHG